MESKFQDLIIRRFNNEFHHLIPHINTLDMYTLIVL